MTLPTKALYALSHSGGRAAESPDVGRNGRGGDGGCPMVGSLAGTEVWVGLPDTRHHLESYTRENCPL